MPRVGACRSCGAAILWAKTSRGKWMPIDAEPTEDGTIVLQGQHDVDAVVLTGEELKNPDGSYKVTPPRHTSHFVTCPNASQHRSAK